MADQPDRDPRLLSPDEDEIVFVHGGIAQYRDGKFYTGMEDPRWQRHITWPVTWWWPIDANPNDHIAALEDQLLRERSLRVEAERARDEAFAHCRQSDADRDRFAKERYQIQARLASARVCDCHRFVQAAGTYYAPKPDCPHCHGKGVRFDGEGGLDLAVYLRNEIEERQDLAERLRKAQEALALAYRLPRPWIGEGVTEAQWNETFDKIEAALKIIGLGFQLSGEEQAT